MSMNITRKTVLLSIAMIAVCLFPAAFGTAHAAPRNVILCIGDGMGAEQVKAARFYLGAALSFEGLPYQAEMTTHSASYPTVTDSAAAGTAIATGVKVYNGVISLEMPGSGAELQTLLEYSRDMGKRTGLITTRHMTNATPAVFGAHEASRNSTAAIAADYLWQSRPNVLFGGGGYGMTSSSALSAGYAVVTDRAGMLALNTAAVAYVSGQFGGGDMPYEYVGLGSLPHLTEMTASALAILEREQKGFFLMVEGGLIDTACHSNDIKRTVHEVVEFHNAVEYVLGWAQGRTDTLVLVTADHETGGLTVTGDNGPGNYPTVSWLNTDHTAANVPVYAWGVNAERVSGVMDNTDIFAICSPAIASQPSPADGEQDVWLVDLCLIAAVESPSGTQEMVDVAFYGRVSGSADFAWLGTQTGVTPGGSASMIWPDTIVPLYLNTGYEWYVTVVDSAATASGPLWGFTITASKTAVTLVSPEGLGVSSPVEFTVAAECVAGSLVNASLYVGIPVQVEDAQLDYNYPNTIMGDAAAIVVDGASPHAHAVIKFGGIFGEGGGRVPLGATIEAATLSLYCSNPGNAMSLYRVTGDWSELTVTANTQPPHDETLVLTTPQQVTGWLNTAVTQFVQAWSSGERNCGIYLADGGTDGVHFDSSEGTNPPVLTVTYHTDSTSATETFTVETTVLDLQETVDIGGASATVMFSPQALGLGDYIWNCLVTATDGAEAWQTQAPNDARFTVESVVAGPTAIDDTATTDEDVAVTIDVLSNDGVDLTVYSVTQPSNGSVTNNDIDVTYTPNADFSGTDTFTYTATDGSQISNSATVTVTVINVDNDPPTAVDDTATTDEDIAITIDVLMNDSDPDTGDGLTVTNLTQPTNGTVGVNSTEQTVTYTPDANWSGSDSFTYTAFDGVNTSNIATVTVTVVAVNDAPVANPDFAATEEETAVTINVLDNDTDVEGDTLTVVHLTQAAHGTASLNAADQTVTYTPDPDFAGEDTFTYTVGDGNGGTSEAVVTVTVINVNDVPVANDDEAEMLQGGSIIIDVLANDTDADSDELTVTGVSSPASGSAVINIDGTVTYTPRSGFAGQDAFTYDVTDGVLSATATVTVYVIAVNYDAYVATNPTVTYGTVSGTFAATTAAGDGLIQTIEEGPNGPAAYSLWVEYALHTSADPANISAPVTIHLVHTWTGQTAEGDALLIELLVAGEWINIASDISSNQYKAAAADIIDAQGNIRIRFRDTLNKKKEARDILAIDLLYAAVTAGPPNQAPAITSAAVISATEDMLYSYDVDASDPDADVLTWSLATAPAGMHINSVTGQITWTPTNEQVGDNAVMVVVMDTAGASDSQSFTVTVANTNDAPSIITVPVTSATAESLYIYDVDATDPDVGDVLTYSLTTAPAGM
ncbi:MAG: tandem-95 repeat protein, partial [Phycisphaerae bacterium]|nr:tandem-95 repeat protein [Phycisphaerae bacterium]